MGSLSTLWKSKELKEHTKVRVLQTCVFSRLLYATETWTLKKADLKRLDAFEMRCYRRILRISWKDKVTNAFIRKKLNRIHSVTDMAKQRKLAFFGHICRMPNDRLVKTVMLGMVEGSRPRGRLVRRWIDDITDRCNCDIGMAVTLAQDRRAWSSKVQAIVNGFNGPPGL